jgi:hypothetical protein
MRYYFINLLRISSPYSFTALGSAMAFPVWVYKSVGGLTAKKSGEDFYFLQKIRKFGKIIIHNTEKVFPASRFSDRVLFGTGPAMIKGSEGNWESYPIYDYQLFDKIHQTYHAFPTLFKTNIETPLSNFISECFNNENIWDALRKNNKDEAHFVKACHDKIDGLRILQFLKNEQRNSERTDEEYLIEFLNIFYSELIDIETKEILTELNFSRTSIQNLDKLRNLLIKIEEKAQKKTK